MRRKLSPGSRQEIRFGRDQELHDPVTGLGCLPDQHARLRVPPDAGPAGGPDGRDGEPDQPHQSDGGDPQGEGCTQGDRGAHHEQVLRQAVQDPRPGQPGEAHQICSPSHRLFWY